MDKKTQAISNKMGALAEDGRALLAATADVAGEKVGEARQRFTDAVDGSKELYGRVREKAAETARVADETLREHPYQAIGFVVGIGALIGYLFARGHFRNGDSSRRNGDSSRDGTNYGQRESSGRQARAPRSAALDHR